MAIEALRKKSPRQVHDDISAYAERYTDHDWRAWLGAGEEGRAALFGSLLRKWQATRPLAMRRVREDAAHEPPFLDELLAVALKELPVLGDLTVMTIPTRTADQTDALDRLWHILRQLPTSGAATCVGITKAVLLVTDGRIGPALDSQVRRALHVARAKTCEAWLTFLQDVAEDIAAFEAMHGTLSEAAPPQWAHVGYGRLYDMALGPR